LTRKPVSRNTIKTRKDTQPVEQKNISVSYVIPCYNEGMDVVESTIRDIQNLEVPAVREIILVDDGSDHDYSQFAGFQDTTLYHHKHNKGYGASLATGIRHSRYDWIAILDADASYPIDKFPELLGLAGSFDMVVGARDWSRISWIKKPTKFILKKLAGYIARSKIPDLNSGMRIFRREIYEDYKRYYPAGFSFSSTLTMVALTQGYEIEFSPITYMKREGKSKIRPVKDSARFTTQLIRLALYFNPMRVFIPLSVCIMLLSITRGILDFRETGELRGMSQLLFVLAIQTFFFGLLAEIINKK